MKLLENYLLKVTSFFSILTLLTLTACDFSFFNFSSSNKETSELSKYNSGSGASSAFECDTLTPQEAADAGYAGSSDGDSGGYAGASWKLISVTYKGVETADLSGLTGHARNFKQSAFDEEDAHFSNNQEYEVVVKRTGYVENDDDVEAASWTGIVGCEPWHSSCSLISRQRHFIQHTTDFERTNAVDNGKDECTITYKTRQIGWEDGAEVPGGWTEDRDALYNSFKGHNPVTLHVFLGSHSLPSSGDYDLPSGRNSDNYGEADFDPKDCVKVWDGGGRAITFAGQLSKTAQISSIYRQPQDFLNGAIYAGISEAGYHMIQPWKGDMAHHKIYADFGMDDDAHWSDGSGSLDRLYPYQQRGSRTQNPVNRNAHLGVDYNAGCSKSDYKIYYHGFNGYLRNELNTSRSFIPANTPGFTKVSMHMLGHSYGKLLDEHGASSAGGFYTGSGIGSVHSEVGIMRAGRFRQSLIDKNCQALAAINASNTRRNYFTWDVGPYSGVNNNQAQFGRLDIVGCYGSSFSNFEIHRPTSISLMHGLVSGTTITNYPSCVEILEAIDSGLGRQPGGIFAGGVVRSVKNRCKAYVRSGYVLKN